MEPNPYLQPGKHFRPQQRKEKLPPHKGNWNLLDGYGAVLCYNSPYPVCVKFKNNYKGMVSYFKSLVIVPCLN